MSHDQCLRQHQCPGIRSKCRQRGNTHIRMGPTFLSLSLSFLFFSGSVKLIVKWPDSRFFPFWEGKIASSQTCITEKASLRNGIQCWEKRLFSKEYYKICESALSINAEISGDKRSISNWHVYKVILKHIRPALTTRFSLKLSGLTKLRLHCSKISLISTGTNFGLLWLTFCHIETGLKLRKVVLAKKPTCPKKGRFFKHHFH